MYLVLKVSVIIIVLITLNCLISLKYTIAIISIIVGFVYLNNLNLCSIRRFRGKILKVIYGGDEVKFVNNNYNKRFYDNFKQNNNNYFKYTNQFVLNRSMETRITSTPLSTGALSLRQNRNVFYTPNTKGLFTTSRDSTPEISNNYSTNRSPLKNHMPIGPLLASTRFNANLSTYTDCKSPGLTSRIVQYDNECNATDRKQLHTHQAKYNGSNVFPIVHFFKPEVPIISPKKPKRVTVKIANPDTSYTQYEQNRILAESMTQELNNSKRQDDGDISTRSVLDALKEISRKRIHANTDYEIDQDSNNKRQRTELTNGNGDYNKRSREDSPIEHYADNNNKKMKRVCVIDPVMASFSSSQLYKQYLEVGFKMKAQDKILEESDAASQKDSKKRLSCTVETQTVEEMPPAKKIDLTPEETKQTKDLPIESKDLEANKNKLKSPSNIVVFDEKKLEANRKNKLITLLGALMGEEPELISQDDVELLEKDERGNTSKDAKPKSILSPINKPKHEKHVTFNLSTSAQGDVTIQEAPKSEGATPSITNNSFITTETTVTTSVNTPISFGGNLSTVTNKLFTNSNELVADNAAMSSSPNAESTFNFQSNSKVKSNETVLTKEMTSKPLDFNFGNKTVISNSNVGTMLQTNYGDQTTKATEVTQNTTPKSGKISFGSNSFTTSTSDAPSTQGQISSMFNTPFSAITPPTTSTASFNNSIQPSAFGAPLSPKTQSSTSTFSLTTTTTAAFGSAQAFTFVSPTTTSSTSMFGEGTSTSQSLFGPSQTSTFGAAFTTQSSVFGTPSTTNTFGTSSTTNTFGTPSTTITFGTLATTNAFGTPSTTTTFETPSTSTTTFGSSSNSSAFGSSNTTSIFGALSATGAFAAPTTTASFAMPSTTSSFTIPATTSAFCILPVSTSTTINPFGMQQPTTTSSNVFGPQLSASFGTVTTSTTSFGFGTTTTTSPSTFGTNPSPSFGSAFGPITTTASNFTNTNLNTVSSMTSFGNNTVTNTFGSGFGATVTSSTTGFGQNSTPTFTFGAKTNTDFAAPNNTAFTPHTNFAFGTPTTQQTPSFGATNTFGGNPSTTTASNAFGNGNVSTFGSNTSTFGNPQSPFTSSFNNGNNNNNGGVGDFSAPTFNQPPFASTVDSPFAKSNAFSSNNNNNSNNNFQPTNFGAQPNKPFAFNNGNNNVTTNPTPGGVFTFGAANSSSNNVFAFGTQDKTKQGNGGFSFPLNTNQNQPVAPFGGNTQNSTFGNNPQSTVAFGNNAQNATTFGTTPNRPFTNNTLFNGPNQQFNVPGSSGLNTGGGSMFSIGSGTSSPRPRTQLKAKRRTQI